MFKSIIYLLLITFSLTGCNSNIKSTNLPVSNSQKKSIVNINNNGDDDNNENLDIILQIDFGDDRIDSNFQFSSAESADNFQNRSLWSVMQEVFEENNIYIDYQDYGGDLGVFIKQIGDKKNGQDGKYWQYLINGEYAKAGVSNYKVRAGDVILWKFANNMQI